MNEPAEIWNHSITHAKCQGKKEGRTGHVYLSRPPRADSRSDASAPTHPVLSTHPVPCQPATLILIPVPEAAFLFYWQRSLRGLAQGGSCALHLLAARRWVPNSSGLAGQCYLLQSEEEPLSRYVELVLFLGGGGGGGGVLFLVSSAMFGPARFDLVRSWPRNNPAGSGNPTNKIICSTESRSRILHPVVFTVQCLFAPVRGLWQILCETVTVCTDSCFSSVHV